MTTPLLSISGLTKHYGGPTGRRVLKDLALELAPGEYAAVMGESGIGKSTLLNLIAGLDRPDAVSIRIEGIELTTLQDGDILFSWSGSLECVLWAGAQLGGVPVAVQGTRDDAAVSVQGERADGDGRQLAPRSSRRSATASGSASSAR